MVPGGEHGPPMLQNRQTAAKIVSTAKHGLDFGDQHRQIKGLGDKIVPTHVHGHDDVHIVRRRGQKNHRQTGDLANLLAPVISVIEGQANVHQNQMGRKGRKLPHDIPEILTGPHFQAPVFSLGADGPGNARIVLHYKNAIHHSAPFSASTSSRAARTVWLRTASRSPSKWYSLAKFFRSSA